MFTQDKHIKAHNSTLVSNVVLQMGRRVEGVAS